MLPPKTNVNLTHLFFIVVSAALYGEFERFGGFCQCSFTLKPTKSLKIRHFEPQKRQYTTTKVG